MCTGLGEKMPFRVAGRGATSVPICPGPERQFNLSSFARGSRWHRECRLEGTLASSGSARLFLRGCQAKLDRESMYPSPQTRMLSMQSWSKARRMESVSSVKDTAVIPYRLMRIDERQIQLQRPLGGQCYRRYRRRRNRACDFFDETGVR